MKILLESIYCERTLLCTWYQSDNNEKLDIPSYRIRCDSLRDRNWKLFVLLLIDFLHNAWFILFIYLNPVSHYISYQFRFQMMRPQIVLNIFWGAGWNIEANDTFERIEQRARPIKE